MRTLDGRTPRGLTHKTGEFASEFVGAVYRLIAYVCGGFGPKWRAVPQYVSHARQYRS
jgi:hypothetical protein